MKKPAETAFPVHELIRDRWSPRAFSDEPVSEEALRSILEAARWAPSAFNEQPWSFIVATKNDKDEFERLLSGLVETNQAWAKEASVLIVSVATKQFQRNQKDNRHALYDVGQATAQLVIEATNRGLVAHQMAGIDRDRIREIYQVPDDREIVAGMAVGHPGDIATLSEGLRERESAPRVRRPQSEWVFTGSWGRSR